MSECTVCNVCRRPGRLEESSETAQISSNVRKYGEEKFTVWRCFSCRSLHSREDVDLTRYYRHYPYQEHSLDFWARAAYGSYLGRLKRAGLRPDHTILDYGCGQGLFLSYLREKGYDNVSGYDAHASRFTDAGVLKRTYDVIIAQDVIEHVDEPSAFIEEMAGYLHREGILCVGTPDANRIELSDKEEYALSLHQPYHRHILSEKALTGLAEAAGFSVVRTYHRYYYDTLYPTVNYRFLRSYVHRGGNVLDVAFEPPRVGMVLKSPLLLFYSIFGYLFPPRSEMMILFTLNR